MNRKNYSFFFAFAFLFCSSSLFAQFAPSDDFDSDGIINAIDLDDDNDGVPDEVESPACFFTSAEAGAITAISSQYSSPDAFSLLFDGNTTTLTFNFASSSMAAGGNIFTVEYPTAITLSNLQVTHNITATAAARARLFGSNDNINYTDLSGVDVNISTTPINFAVNANSGNYKYYRIQCTVAGTLAPGNTIAEIVGTLSSPYVASMYPKSTCSALNHFNLDSDGDGCSDAFESGATQSLTSNFTFSAPFGANGLADAVETTPDNGVLNYTSQHSTYATNAALIFCDVYQSLTGKVFMDFNGNSLQSSHLQEPGVKNVTVRAYKPDGNFIDAITDSLGNYSFNGAQITTGTKLRIEFLNLPAGYFDGFVGNGSNTTVQFVTTSVGNSAANLALSLPGHYSSTLNPYYAFVQFRRNTGTANEQTIWFLNDNNAVNFVANAATDANRNWSMPNVTGVANFPIPTRYEVANQSEVGSTLGLAWDKKHQLLLTGSYMRGFADLGTNTSTNGFGEGVIYKANIDKTSLAAGNPAVWLDLETILGNDIAGTYVADGNWPGAAVYGRTNLNPNKIGYTGLGMMKYTRDGSHLLVANLNTLEIFAIPVNPSNGEAAVTSAADIKRFLLPTIEAPGSWANGNPYRAILGLGIHPVTGRAYVTLTCNGPALANLKGVVYSFDPSDNTPDSSDFVKELEIPLNIDRPSTNPNVLQWFNQTNHPWENVTANTAFYSSGSANNTQHMQPWLSEVLFDALPNGTFGMTIMERNRYHDIINGSFYVTGGVMYRATLVGSQWVLENDKVAQPLTSTVSWSYVNANYAGSNTSVSNRFYKYVGAEGSFTQGTADHVPGSSEIIMPAMDNVFYSGTSGISWINRITGERSRDARHLSDFTATGYNNTPFTKANNFGDLEVLGELPPLEIGNRVWMDDDSDGIQDPDENGIGGVILNLYQGNTLVGTTTTNNDGTYYFTQSNVNLNGANGLLPNTAYEIRIDNAQGVLVGFELTGTNTDASSNGDARDNDGSGTANAVIAFTTGFYGENNHTYDFGYKNALPPQPACLGNYVWIDDDQDGLQNNGEVGVAGITVTLYNNTGTVLSSTITDAYGYYKFCPLDPGSYRVGFTLPANYVFTGLNSGNDSLDSDVSPTTGLTSLYTLASGDTNWTVDAGIYFQRKFTATVGNYVWYDADVDGTQDPSEEGVSGVTVTLYNAIPEPVATTITDANGFYLFTDVAPGTYCVGFTQPVALVFSPNNGSVDDPNNSDANTSTGKTQNFVVNAGDEITTVDAGLYSPPVNVCGLGDKVWYDINQDGVQDLDESGVPNVTATLYQADGTTVISTTTTNAYGNYIFNNLNPGTYVVGFSNLPSNYVLTSTAGTNPLSNSDADMLTGKTVIITLTAGQKDMSWDAGIHTTNVNLTNSLGNFVWYDDNKDGVQDPSELGVPGVTVKLYDASNTVLASTSTDQYGFYLFPDLPNGNYYVGFSNIPLGYVFSPADQTSDLQDSDPNQSNGLTPSVALVGNTHDRSLDAGINKGDIIIGLGSLGDLVWYDMNNNGLQDLNELGVPGVSVTLFEDDFTTILATTTTDALGNYIFTGLDAGQYVVGFTNLPSGFTLSPKDADGLGINGAVNSDVNSGTQKTDVIALGSGEDKMTVDMGIVPNSTLASLGNLVWFDLNNDGLQSANEPGVQGVTVTLYDNINAPIATTTTNNVGQYLFAGLTPATYNVGFSNLPDGYTLTTQNSDAQGIQGTLNSDADVTTGLTLPVTLSANEYNPNLDAGIVSNIVASVGDYVWFDINKDGIQDANETPIGGVLVTLVNNSNVPVASAITKPDGGYIFTNVIPGSYTMKFSQTPDGMDYTTQETNNASNTGSNADPLTGFTPSFVVNAGSHNPTIDAGLTVPPLAGVGNYVWLDTNINGLQDQGEVPVPGVLVTLYSNDGTTILATTTTNGDGAYSFTNLPAGSYVVGFSNYPSGTAQTINVGSLNDPFNSDAGNLGRSAVFTLAPGEFNPNIDAGLYFTSPLSTNLLQFDVVQNDCKVVLNWSVSSNESAKEFELKKRMQHSNEMKTLAIIKANTVSQSNQYTFTDFVTEKGNNAYQLWIRDIDNKVFISSLEQINLACDPILEAQIYPNPTEDELSLFIPFLGEEDAVVYVHDLSGRIIYTQQIAMQENTVVRIPFKSLAKGVYQLSLQHGIDRKIFRVLKN